MENEITILLSEIKSDKVSVRQKAVEKFTEILTNYPDEVESFIEHNEHISWNSIFKDVNLSINSNAQKLHSGKTDVPHNDKKIITFENLLLRVCNAPRDGEFH